MEPQRLAPIALEVDLLDGAAPTGMPVIVGDQAAHQCGAGQPLQPRIERGANRETAAVELVLAEAVENLAAHLLGEIFGGENLGSALALDDAERLGLGGLAFVPWWQSRSRRRGR